MTLALAARELITTSITTRRAVTADLVLPAGREEVAERSARGWFLVAPSLLALVTSTAAVVIAALVTVVATDAMTDADPVAGITAVV